MIVMSYGARGILSPFPLIDRLSSENGKDSEMGVTVEQLTLFRETVTYVGVPSQKVLFRVQDSDLQNVARFLGNKGIDAYSTLNLKYWNNKEEPMKQGYVFHETRIKLAPRKRPCEMRKTEKLVERVWDL